jgi:hypothetical protein
VKQKLYSIVIISLILCFTSSQNQVAKDATLCAVIEESLSLQKVITGDYWCCIRCKELEKSLEASLIKMKQGFTTNGNKHLKDIHPERVKELKNDDSTPKQTEKVRHHF